MDINPGSLYSALADDLAKFLPYSICKMTPREIAGAVLPPDMQSHRSVAAFSMLQSFQKKLEVKNSRSADTAALEKFTDVNDRMRQFSFRTHSGSHPYVIDAYEEAKAVFARSCHINGYSPFDSDDIFQSLDVGPGASIGARGGSFYCKTAEGRLTSPNAWLIRMYEEYIQQPCNSLLRATELNRREEFGLPIVIEYNKLGFAPKYVWVSRTICTETVLGMKVQQGISDKIVTVLRREFVVDLIGLHGSRPQQDKNRRLAMEASLSGTSVTLDLESASDSCSLAFAKDFYPADLAWWLSISRSKATQLPNGDVVPLHMLSTMGNGFTFSLMTWTFVAMVEACYKVLGLEIVRPYGKRLGNYAVYGDDIIVDVRARGLLVSLLDYCGYKVNDQKSFHEGTFRESCGGDFNSGRWVRGVYCRRCASIQDKVSLFNRLVRWSVMTDVPIYGTLEMLYLHLTLKGAHVVPPWEQDTAGVKLPLDVALSKATVSRTKASLDTSKPFYTGSYVYFRYMAKMKGHFLRDESWSKCAGKGLFYNPDGIILASVKGTILGGRISVRIDRVFYDSHFGIAPCWDDYLGQPEFTTPGFWAKWNSLLVIIDLGGSMM